MKVTNDRIGRRMRRGRLKPGGSQGGLCSPGGSQGNALVLSVLILLALTSVGLVSIQRTNTDVMVVGNLTRATQAHIASEAGVVHGLARVGGAPGFFVGGIDIQKRGGNALLDFPSRTGNSIHVWNRIIRGGFSTVLADTDPSRIPHVAYDSAARIRQDVAYRVEIFHVKQIEDAPGYGVGSDVCLQLFDFTAEGGLPAALLEPVALTMDGLPGVPPDTVVVRNRVRAAAGPVKCE